MCLKPVNKTGNTAGALGDLSPTSADKRVRSCCDVMFFLFFCVSPFKWCMNGVAGKSDLGYTPSSCSFVSFDATLVYSLQIPATFYHKKVIFRLDKISRL